MHGPSKGAKVMRRRHGVQGRGASARRGCEEALAWDWRAKIYWSAEERIVTGLLSRACDVSTGRRPPICTVLASVKNTSVW